MQFKKLFTQTFQFHRVGNLLFVTMEYQEVIAVMNRFFNEKLELFKEKFKEVKNVKLELSLRQFHSVPINIVVRGTSLKLKPPMFLFLEKLQLRNESFYHFRFFGLIKDIKDGYNINCEMFQEKICYQCYVRLIKSDK